MRRAVALVVVVVAACAVVAAASVGAARSTYGPATVLAAASLTEVVPKIDGAARVSFGGSNQLAQQARQGFPFDVFLSASPQYTQALFAEGLVRRPVAFAMNSLVLIVPRRNPAGLSSVADLARRPRLRLVVAGPKVPIGLYTREVLKRLSAAKQTDSLPVVVMTAHGSIHAAVEAMKEGAYDFLTKPLDKDHLLIVIRKALERGSLQREVVYLRFFADLTQAEIAARLGVSQMHVSRILRGALETMRDALN